MIPNIISEIEAFKTLFNYNSIEYPLELSKGSIKEYDANDAINLIKEELEKVLFEEKKILKCIGITFRHKFNFRYQLELPDSIEIPFNLKSKYSLTTSKKVSLINKV